MSKAALAKDARGILNSAGPEALRAAVADAELLGMEPETAPILKVKIEGAENSTKSQTYSTSPPDIDRLTFDPERVFYATGTGSYLVDTGTHYRTYSRKSPVIAGINRHLRATGHSEDDLKGLVPHHFENIELDRACDWTSSGNHATRRPDVPHH
jgi:hypothetical protein